MGSEKDIVVWEERKGWRRQRILNLEASKIQKTRREDMFVRGQLSIHKLPVVVPTPLHVLHAPFFYLPPPFLFIYLFFLLLLLNQWAVGRGPNQ